MRSKCLSATSVGQFRISDQKHPAGTVLPTNPNKTKTQTHTHIKGRKFSLPVLSYSNRKCSFDLTEGQWTSGLISTSSPSQTRRQSFSTAPIQPTAVPSPAPQGQQRQRGSATGLHSWTPTMFSGPSRLRDTGTISSLALLGRLANLHWRERSSTVL